MKLILSLAATLGLGAFAALAQQHPSGGPGGFGGPHGRGHHPPPMPLMIALDLNTNGVLEATEIANAPAALATLDKNGDGKLTMDELMPPRAEGTNQLHFAPPEGAKRPVPPLIAALDTNGDGELDATEIANASASLLQLDTNGDGELTPDEIHPHMPGGPGGEGGAGGPGRGPGPGGPPPSAGQ
jgi:hypothetical protein